ncbi:hypothetical protein SEA_ALONE_217 [Streptomyces phage Alone3]|nr:hypothetical protein SEA_ALONE_217 [Streptomyces phage Alone3]
MGKVLAAIMIAVASFSIGVYSGWDSGVRDGKAIYSCPVDK